MLLHHQERESRPTYAEPIEVERASGQSSLAALLILAALPLIAGAWALMSPKLVVLQEMPWDLLFNLAGAWHLHSGHVQHVDFHEPVGQLNFLLTQAGFHVVGPSPRAFLVGTIIMAVIVYLCAAFAAWHRLPLTASVIFVTFITLLVLMPANVGDKPDIYSFAMSYNRYGWSILSVIAFILFLPPSDRSSSGISAMAAVAGLTLVLFHLKITYFAVALAAVVLAVLVSPHIRRSWLSWAAIVALATLYALAKPNWPYLSDLMNAAANGGVRSGIHYHVNKIFHQPLEAATYTAAVVVAIWLWVSGRAPLRLPAAVCFLVVSGVLLLSQNAQSHGLPVGIIIVFLLYGQLMEPRRPRSQAVAPLMLVALLVFPITNAGAAALSLAGYWQKAASGSGLYVIHDTRLEGLAVPSQSDDLLSAFASVEVGFPLLNRARTISPRYELSSSEYVSTLVEAADFLRARSSPGGRIVVLDQVNPLPFMLGILPARGENLWSGLGAPVQPAEKLFADSEHVLIPKFSTYSAWTDQAVRLYGPYIFKHFPSRQETRSWIKFSRSPHDHLGPSVRVDESALATPNESRGPLPGASRPLAVSRVR